MSDEKEDMAIDALAFLALNAKEPCEWALTTAKMIVSCEKMSIRKMARMIEQGVTKSIWNDVAKPVALPPDRINEIVKYVATETCLSVNGVDGCIIPKSERYYCDSANTWCYIIEPDYEEENATSKPVDGVESCAFACAWWRMQRLCYTKNNILWNQQAWLWQGAFEKVVK